SPRPPLRRITRSSSFFLTTIPRPPRPTLFPYTTLFRSAEGGKGMHRPRGRMVVLAAVFPDSGRIALDVSGIERHPIEGRREQQGQTVAVINELFGHGGHGAQGTSGIGRPGDHAPGLRNRVDPAFAASGRAQWRPVVVIAAPIPTSIPTILLKSVLQRRHMGSPV